MRTREKDVWSRCHREREWQLLGAIHGLCYNSARIALNFLQQDSVPGLVSENSNIEDGKSIPYQVDNTALSRASLVPG